MSKLSDLLHKLVTLAPFHSETLANDAHALVDDIEKEWNPATAPEETPEPAPES